MMVPMPSKPTRKRQKDDREEYKRFLETAKKVEASDDPKDFERAFNRVTSKPSGRRSRHSD